MATPAAAAAEMVDSEEALSNPELESTADSSALLGRASSILSSGYEYMSKGYELAKSATEAVMDAARRTSDTANAIRQILTHLSGSDGKIDATEQREAIEGFSMILQEFWDYLPPHVSRMHFMFWLLRYAMQAPQIIPPEKKHDPVSLEELQLLRHYVRYCSASYGKLAVGFMSRSVSKMIAEKKDHQFEKFVSQYTGLAETDVIHVDSKGGLHRPVHYVAVDKAMQAVVVSLRGSMNMSDLLTDLNCKPDTFIYLGKSYHCHQGMLRSARELDIEIRPLVLALLEANPRYKVVIVGHSLGAGVGALLAAIWHSEQNSELSQTTCYAFGTPCTCDLNLSQHLQPIVKTVVVGDDVVPRLSLASMHGLRKRVVTTFDYAADEEEFPCDLQSNLFAPAPSYPPPPPPTSGNPIATSGADSDAKGLSTPTRAPPMSPDRVLDRSECAPPPPPPPPSKPKPSPNGDEQKRRQMGAQATCRAELPAKRHKHAPALLPRLPPVTKRYPPKEISPDTIHGKDGPRSRYREPNYTRLFPPGRILWAPGNANTVEPAKTSDEDEKKSTKPDSSSPPNAISQRMRSVAVEEFGTIVISSSMFTSHLPLRYEKAVAEAEYHGLIETASRNTADPCLPRAGAALAPSESPGLLIRPVPPATAVREEDDLAPSKSKKRHDSLHSDQIAAEVLILESPRVSPRVHEDRAEEVPQRKLSRTTSEISVGDALADDKDGGFEIVSVSELI